MIIEIYIIFPTTFFTLPPTISSKTTFLLLIMYLMILLGGFPQDLSGFMSGLPLSVTSVDSILIRARRPRLSAERLWLGQMMDG